MSWLGVYLLCDRIFWEWIQALVHAGPDRAPHVGDVSSSLSRRVVRRFRGLAASRISDFQPVLALRERARFSNQPYLPAIGYGRPEQIVGEKMTRCGRKSISRERIRRRR